MTKMANTAVFEILRKTSQKDLQTGSRPVCTCSGVWGLALIKQKMGLYPLAEGIFFGGLISNSPLASAKNRKNSLETNLKKKGTKMPNKQKKENEKVKSKRSNKLEIILIVTVLGILTSCSTSREKRDYKIVKVLRKQNELIETIRENYDEMTVKADEYYTDDLTDKKVPIDESLLTIIESNDVIIEKLSKKKEDDEWPEL